MAGYVASRVIQALVIVMVASFLVFLFMHAIPSDPAIVYAGYDPTPEKLAAVRASFGLDKPLPVQYFVWGSHAIKGDFGASYFSGLPVRNLIAFALPATLELTLAAILFALVIGITTGTLAALNHGGALDYTISAGSSIALGIPNFWFGTMLIILFALWIRLVPPAGRDVDNPISAVRTLILPMCALGLELGAILSKYTKNSLLEVLAADYVRTARAKGLPGAVVLYKHALRTSLGPIITIVGIELARLLGGAVVVENVFAWPGIGRLMVQSLAQRDYLVLQAVLLLIITVFVALNLLVDLSYLIVDPRVVLTRHGP